MARENRIRERGTRGKKEEEREADGKTDKTRKASSFLSFSSFLTSTAEGRGNRQNNSIRIHPKAKGSAASRQSRVLRDLLAFSSSAATRHQIPSCHLLRLPTRPAHRNYWRRSTLVHGPLLHTIHDRPVLFLKKKFAWMEG